MCDTQLSVPTPYGCKRRHHKPTRAPPTTGATQQVWKLPKLKQTRNVEPWIEWDCHRNSIRALDTMENAWKENMELSIPHLKVHRWSSPRPQGERCHIWAIRSWWTWTSEKTGVYTSWPAPPHNRKRLQQWHHRISSWNCT